MGLLEISESDARYLQPPSKTADCTQLYLYRLACVTLPVRALGKLLQVRPQWARAEYSNGVDVFQDLFHEKKSSCRGFFHGELPHYAE